MGLTWNGLATAIGVNIRQVLRWHKKGCEPPGGVMLALVDFAIQAPGAWAFSRAGTWWSRCGAGNRAMERQRWVYRVEPCHFPEDFPQRL